MEEARYTQSAQNAMIYYPVPRLVDQTDADTPKPTKNAPAVISYIIRTKESQSTASAADSREHMYFYIGRDRTTALKSFTISYRFSALPIMIEDPAHPFYTYEYTDADIDDHEYLLCKFNLPPAMAQSFPGCVAYISRILTADGTEYTFSTEDFAYSSADAAKVQQAMDAFYGEETLTSNASHDDQQQNFMQNAANGGAVAEEMFDPLAEVQYAQSRERKKRFRGVRLIGYALLVAGSVTLLSAGVHYLSYQRTMLGAAVYIDAGQHTQAETYVNEAIGDNLFLNSQKSSLSRTVLRLCTEERYNEAYKIAAGTPFASILQNICEEASEKALESGDYQTAYLYAAAAPIPFTEEITDAAAAVVLDPYTSEIDMNAYSVAQKTTDTAELDNLLSSIVRYACSENKYHVAMRAANKINDEEMAVETIADVFRIATAYYISGNSYDEAVTFINAYSTGSSTFDDSVKTALIDYFSTSHDAKNAFFLAKQFGVDSSDILVEAEDSAVRADIAGLYPLLTTAQKRSYHANRITAGGLLLTLSDKGTVTLAANPSGVTPANGKDTSMTDAQKRITDLLAGKPAVVSMASGALTTAFLHENGTVTMISNRVIGNSATAALPEETTLILAAQSIQSVIAVDAGGDHFVFLYADGTVKAIGDNSHGQCDTTGNAWTDIVAVAAGADFTLGLKSDGTVVACGSNAASQCNVSAFHNVVDIDASGQTTVVLFSDGTIGMRGERSMGIGDAVHLENVMRIRAGGTAIIAEHKDGTFTLCGSCAETGNYGSVASWSQVVDFDVGYACAAAIEQNGTIRTTGSNRAKQ